MKCSSILAMGLALMASQGHAYEGLGKNPGDWKMMPASLEQQADILQLRLRNLDFFAKLCSLEVRYKGDVLIDKKKLVIKADRSVELPLAGKAAEAVSWQDLESNMACVKIEDAEAIEKIPDPATLKCELSKESCEHICEADPKNVDRCVNEHLVIDFMRPTYKTSETAEEYTAQAEFVSQAKEDLICQLVITAKISGPVGDASYVVAPSQTVTIEAGKSQIVSWTFNKAEAGEGRELDLSRPRVAGLCSPDLGKKADDWYRQCQPLKRSECNWVVAR